MSMSMNDINRFYAQNENVSVTGAVKRAFTEQGVDIEKVVADMTTAGGSELMSAFGMTADQIKAMDFTQFAAAFNKLDSQQARVDLLNKLETSGALRPEVKNAMLSNLGERMDRFGLASDKGTMRTARIRQAEEAERARNGGMTSMEITATAITENQRMLNDVFKSDSSMQNVLSQGLKQIRDSKIAEKVKGGMSQQEAETAVDQDGFSFTELLQSASGVTDPGMRKAVQESLANIDSDLAAAKSSGDTARLQILERQKADMTAFNQILETKDPAERAKKIETLRTEVERDIMNKDKVEREKMTEQQKQTDEAQKATLTSAKTMVDLLAVNRLMASSMSSTAESLKSLDTKVSA
jgi:hypothetical protein